MITTPALGALRGVRHGFFTREGGVSDGLHATLNCGYGAADDTDAVTENRARAARRLGVEPDALVTGYQTHSAVALVVSRAWARADAPRADALITRTPGLALGVLTADCAPVLLAGDGVIAVAHAGWRGAVAGILEATLSAMAGLGARPDRIVAAVGPCIAQKSYEVGAEFPQPFLAQNPDNTAYFARAEKPAHFQFDLAGYVVARLARLGIGPVETTGRDTYGEPDIFFSYRRSVHRQESSYGRGLSAITIAG